MTDDLTSHSAAPPSGDAGRVGTSAPSGSPSNDAKPKGPFSTKKVRLVCLGCLAISFCYLVLISRKQTNKVTSRERDRRPDVEMATTSATRASERDYASAVSSVMGKDAQRLDEEMRRAGGVHVSSQASYSSRATVQPHRLDTAAQDGELAPYPSPLSGPDARPQTATRIDGTTTGRERDPQAEALAQIDADARKREAQSYFAPLLAVNNRPKANPQEARETTGAAPGADSTARAPVLSQPGATLPPTRTIGVPQTPGPFKTQVQQTATIPASQAQSVPRVDVGGPASPAPDTPSHSRSQNVLNAAAGPLHKLFEGTVVETVLTNRLNGTYTGPLNCMVTVDVWSQNRQHLLIPRGARVLGEAHRVSTTGQQRLAVAFHRIIMPDGFSISLDKFTGMNQIGETGLKDKVDNHYRQIFGVSLALGAIAGLTSRGASYGTSQTGMDAWRQGFSQSASQEATQILERYLNILPTVMIRERNRIKIYLTDDLMLPAYDGHHMSSDL